MQTELAMASGGVLVGSLSGALTVALYFIYNRAVKLFTEYLWSIRLR